MAAMIWLSRPSTFLPVRRLFQKRSDRPALGEAAERSLNAQLGTFLVREGEARRRAKLAVWA